MALWAVGLGLGALKGLKDERAAERDRKLQALTAMYSPWTGMSPSKVKEGDVMGSAMQGVTGGLGMQQSMDQAAAQDAINKAQLENIQLQNKRMEGGLDQFAGFQPSFTPAQGSAWSMMGRRQGMA